jgi:flagellar M-ring protein FliF
MSTTEPAVDLPGTTPGVDAKNVVAQLRERVTTLISGFSKGQRTTLAVAGVAVVLLVLAVAWMRPDPAYTQLYSGLEPADAGAVTAKLKEMGVPYRLAAGGTAVEVPADDVYQVRADLATTDLPSSSKVGYGILDDQGLTTSEFSQRIGFQRAMEGELAKTIEAIDGVDTAVVHLAIPKDEVFALEKSQATASVMVKTDGTLGAEQVRAIRNLVSSSIEDLPAESVSVSDSSGKVLAAPGQAETAASSGGSEDVLGAYQQRLASQIESTLEASLGAGKVKATVAADLDLDQVSSTIERYEPAPVQDGQATQLALEESTKTETYGSNGDGTAGQLGIDGTPEGGATGAGDYALQEQQRRNAVNKTVETIIRQPGSVRRLSIAVLVDEDAVGAGQVGDLTTVVSRAAGLQEDRGDSVVVTRMPFDESLQDQMKGALESRKAPESSSPLLLIVGVAAVVIAIAIAAFVVLRRRKRQLIDLEELAARAEQLTWEDVTDAPTEATPIVTGTFAGDDQVSTAVSVDGERPAVDRHEDRREALSELIDNQPDEVAQLLRGWLADRRTVRR